VWGTSGVWGTSTAIEDKSSSVTVNGEN
jgi:hypothetical protein